MEHPVKRLQRIQKEINNPIRNWGTGYTAEVMMEFAKDYHQHKLNWFQKLPLHYRYLLHTVAGFVLGLTIMFVFDL